MKYEPFTLKNTNFCYKVFSNILPKYKIFYIKLLYRIFHMSSLFINTHYLFYFIFSIPLLWTISPCFSQIRL